MRQFNNQYLTFSIKINLSPNEKYLNGTINSKNITMIRNNDMPQRPKFNPVLNENI